MHRRCVRLIPTWAAAAIAKRCNNILKSCRKQRESSPTGFQLLPAGEPEPRCPLKASAPVGH